MNFQLFMTGNRLKMTIRIRSPPAHGRDDDPLVAADQLTLLPEKPPADQGRGHLVQIGTPVKQRVPSYSPFDWFLFWRVKVKSLAAPRCFDAKPRRNRGQVK